MSQITWYIEPKDSYTNKVLQTELNGAEMVYLNNNFGMNVKAYQVDHSFITQLNRSKSDLNLQYNVYKKEGKHGLAKNFDFSFLAKKQKNKKLKK